jgi:hypothetical protein
VDLLRAADAAEPDRHEDEQDAGGQQRRGRTEGVGEELEHEPRDAMNSPTAPM